MALRPATADLESVGAAGIPVVIRRSDGAKRLTIRISAATGAVSLTVPRWTTRRAVRRFLDDHESWITSRTAVLPKPIDLGEGSVLTIAGQPLELASRAGRGVRLAGAQLQVPGLAAADKTPAMAALRGWLRERARAHATEACDRYAAQADRPYAALTLRDPRTRWGSCTSEGRLMLSWRLIFAPVEVFDYVAAHEVAHLVEMNHSPAFWAVVEQMMPDYRGRRDWLRANGAGLHRIVV